MAPVPGLSSLISASLSRSRLLWALRSFIQAVKDGGGQCRRVLPGPEPHHPLVETPRLALFPSRRLHHAHSSLVTGPLEDDTPACLRGVLGALGELMPAKCQVPSAIVQSRKKRCRGEEHVFQHFCMRLCRRLWNLRSQHPVCRPHYHLKAEKWCQPAFCASDREDSGLESERFPFNLQPSVLI